MAAEQWHAEIASLLLDEGTLFVLEDFGECDPEMTQMLVDQCAKEEEEEEKTQQATLREAHVARLAWERSRDGIDMYNERELAIGINYILK